MNRSKLVQKWIASDPLREKWWSRKCPYSGADSELHHLAFHLRMGSLNEVVRVSCMECGVLEEIE